MKLVFVLLMTIYGPTVGINVLDRLHSWLLFDGYCIEALDSGYLRGSQPVMLQLGLIMTKEGPTGK